MGTIEDDITNAASVLRSGGIILYPTDTIWGIGCDATNGDAVKRIYQLKKRDEKKSMIILLADLDEIAGYVSRASKKILDFLSRQKTPTTAIFDNAIHLPAELINEDGSIAIRIVQDKFCKSLISQSGYPLVSTSANVSGNNYPQTFFDIAGEVREGVDYVVTYRQDDTNISRPSMIFRLNGKGEIERIR